ncbi:hypothetical protein [Francisella sp. 19X1-34]|uniref:hypothetical protein n=1 Tax=Francisella sp. 19X1-34 TaxID=3087177 RepID=UPI002E2F1241|nr:hypothetical protein [Francisella sp. 19X1-34]MED7789145.1 hypothetical protein [Francisella sp. 19X1-34]
MKYIELYDKDGLSYFEEKDFNVVDIHNLGVYSKPYFVDQMLLREFKEGETFYWHNISRKHYIIYLSGKVEVKSSSGEVRLFQQGDILLANDCFGKGHFTRVIESGSSIIVTAR